MIHTANNFTLKNFIVCSRVCVHWYKAMKKAIGKRRFTTKDINKGLCSLHSLRLSVDMKKTLQQYSLSNRDLGYSIGDRDYASSN